MKGLVLAGIAVAAAGIGWGLVRRGEEPTITAAAPAARARTARPKPPALPVPAPFAVIPGERLAYTVRWSQMDAATAEFAVAAGPEPGNVRIDVTAATTGLVRALFDAAYEFSALCDGRTLLPITVRRHAREAGREKRDVAHFHRQKGEIEVGGAKRPIDPAAHDPLTVLYALRTAKIGPVGSTGSYYVTDLGTPFKVKMEVQRREAGTVDLLLTSREIGKPAAEPMQYRVKLEDRGARRILELRVTLPVGEIVVALVP